MKHVWFYLILFLVFSISGLRSQVDSLKLALKVAKHDTTRCYILFRLSETASDEEWPIYNKQLFKLTENLCSKERNKQLLELYTKYYAAALNNMAIISWQEGRINESLDWFLICLKKLELVKDEMGVALALNNIGSIYDIKGDIPNALFYLHKALKIQERIGYKKGMATSYNNIGQIYERQDDPKMAIEYYQKSLKLQEAISDKRGAAISLINIGAVYYRRGDIDNALPFFEKSLVLNEEINYKQGISYSLSNLSSIYDDKKDFEKALDYNLKSLKIREEIKDVRGIALSLTNMANLMLKTGKLNEALAYGKRGLKTAQELASPENIKKSAAALKLIYKKQNSFKDALEMYELEIKMRDSVNNEATKKASIKTQLKYEYEKKSAADSVKNAEAQKVKDAQLEAQSASLKQEKTQRYALYGGLVLVAGFLVFVVNRFRITNKQKKIIEEQKIVVDQAFEKLHEKNKEVMDSIYYARRIQRALVTSEFYIEKNLNRLTKVK